MASVLEQMELQIQLQYRWFSPVIRGATKSWLLIIYKLDLAIKHFGGDKISSAVLFVITEKKKRKINSNFHKYITEMKSDYFKWIQLASRKMKQRPSPKDSLNFLCWCFRCCNVTWCSILPLPLLQSDTQQTTQMPPAIVKLSISKKQRSRTEHRLGKRLPSSSSPECYIHVYSKMSKPSNGECHQWKHECEAQIWQFIQLYFLPFNMTAFTWIRSKRFRLSHPCSSQP
jgi:hypothetical protein